MCDVEDEISQEHVQKVSFLIDNGADINVRDDRYEMTVLHLLARRGQKLNKHENNLIKLLVKNGADLEAKGPFGLKPLFYSVLKGDAKRAETFLKLGADVNATVPFLKMPKKVLTWLAIEKLFPLGPIPTPGLGLGVAMAYWKATIPSREDMEKIELRGDTPLHIAVRKNDVNMAILLLEYNANPNAKNYRGYTPIAYAKSQRMKDLLSKEKQKQQNDFEDVD